MKNFTNVLKDADSFDLAYKFIQKVSDMDYEYIYRGEFTKSIVSNIISMTSHCIETQDYTPTLKKKIFFILVECLQNIAKHQDKLPYDLEYEPAIVIIQKRDMRYYVTTGNVIENQHIDDLKYKLEKINNMDAKQLKAYYNDVLVNVEVSDKGGAGLGLISMARKTVDNKLYYDFQKLNDDLSYFYLRSEIPIERNVENNENTQWKLSFEKIKSMRATLSKEKVFLNFSGSFDKENLENLIPIVESHIDNEDDFRKRMFNIIYDMLNNIVDYAEDYLSDERTVGNSTGIFLLSAQGNKLFLTSGNYIHESVVKRLRQKIDFINNNEKEKLLGFKKNLSAYFEMEEIKQPDFNLIDMKLRSKNNLLYKFNEISNNYSFFTIRAIMDLEEEG